MDRARGHQPVPEGTDYRLALLLWLAGVPGAIAGSWLAIPVLVAGQPVPVPLATLQVATAVQSLVLLAVAAIAGARLAPRVGLQAPVAMALAAKRPALPELRRQLLPGAAGAMTGAAIIVAFGSLGPTGPAGPGSPAPIPLVVRLLYGGITEEVLVRWGLLTWFAWLAWRVLQHGRGRVSKPVIALAIGASSLAFGLSHLPAASAGAGGLSLGVAAWITLGNAAFGAVAGVLYWRHGLEAAILAHLLAHAIAFAVTG